MCKISARKYFINIRNESNFQSKISAFKNKCIKWQLKKKLFIMFNIRDCTFYTIRLANVDTLTSNGKLTNKL